MRILSLTLCIVILSFLIQVGASAQAPVIDNISKTIFTSGESLRINGSNFGSVRGTSFVSFNNIQAESYPVWGSSSIVVTVPDDIESGQVTVTVAGTKSNGIQYTYQKKFKLLTTVKVYPGSFLMGDETGEGFDNIPAHQVQITREFEIGITEVTQKEWKTVMDGSNPSHVNDTGDAKPVQQVSFLRAVEFCNRLSVMEGFEEVYIINDNNVTWDLKKIGYRLPTEAEWEYAARAGRTGSYTNSEILEMAWVGENAGGKIHPGQQREANDWGIYDMFGNVSEWCWDYYDSEYYSASQLNDPIGPATSSFSDRIIRGGSFINGADACNSAFRSSYPTSNDNVNFDLGLRVVINKIGLSIEDNNEMIGFSVTPNPATDYIEINNVMLSEAKDPVVVFDVLGIKYMDSRIRENDMFEISGDRCRINISSLPKGVYFVRIGSQILKFVKI